MTFRAVGVLLASGRGMRFDATGVRNKLIERLPDGRAIVRASAEALLEAVDALRVVVPPQHAALLDALDGLPIRITVNPRASEGMGTSIAAGVAAEPDASAWLIALGDMPFLRAASLRALCDALERGASIVAPRFQGERGHPVGFAAPHFTRLTALDGDQGARALLRGQSIEFVDVPDSGILYDIDTPGDLVR